MELLGALKNELFRPFATLIVPGVIALLPYWLLLHVFESRLTDFYSTYTVVSVSVFLIFALALGMILENFGSLIEICADKIFGDEHKKTWEKYLKLHIKDEMIGQRYLRTLVTRLKFELSMIVAIPVSCIGFLLFNQMQLHWTGVEFFVLSVLIFVFYLGCEIFMSMKALHSTRILIIEGHR